MNKKKVLWIVVLILFIGAIVAIVKIANSKNSTNDANIVDNTYNKNSNAVIEDTTDQEIEYQKTELEDGILYSIDGKEYQSDLVIGDNYYDTTINDIFLNPETYMEKNIEIEGMYLENLPWTFVGRYSTSNVCVYCPEGYSYFEYEWQEGISLTARQIALLLWTTHNYVDNCLKRIQLQMKDRLEYTKINQKKKIDYKPVAPKEPVS